MPRGRPKKLTDVSAGTPVETMTTEENEAELKALSEDFGQNKDLKFQQMIASGIPVAQAVFQSAVNNGDNSPENMFSDKSGTPARRVQMWMCPPILLCYHKDQYFFTPLANVAHARFK